jgi:SSS family solute:Na+ symporter
MGFVFVICVIGMYFISIYDQRKGIECKGLEIERSMFKLSTGFLIGVLVICSILAALYTIFW